MNKGFTRNQRVEEVIHHCLARSLQADFKDPRVGRVTVLSVDLSRDLKSARVYISLLELEQKEQTLQILNRAQGFFRSQIAQVLHLRIVPQLVFQFDDSVERGHRIESLLASCLPSTPAPLA